MSIYGLILALMMITRLKRSSAEDPFAYPDYFTGYTFFWGGMTVGVVNLVSGAAVGVLGSAVVLADAANPHVFMKVLVVEVLASAISLIGLIVGFVQIGTAKGFQ